MSGSVAYTEIVEKQLRIYLTSLLGEGLLDGTMRSKAEVMLNKQIEAISYVCPTRTRTPAVECVRCLARIWMGDAGIGHGRQCSKKRVDGVDFCKSHNKAHLICPTPCSYNEQGKPYGMFYGRIDEEVPITSPDGTTIVLKWNGPPAIVEKIKELVESGIPYRIKPKKKKKKAPTDASASASASVAKKVAPKPWFYFLKSRRALIKTRLCEYCAKGWSFKHTLILLERECFDMDRPISVCEGVKCEDSNWATSGPKTMYRKVASLWWAYLKKESPGTIEEIMKETLVSTGLTPLPESTIPEMIPDAPEPRVVEDQKAQLPPDDNDNDFLPKRMASGGMALVTTNSNNMYNMKDLVIGRGIVQIDFCEGVDSMKDYGWGEIYGMPIGHWFDGAKVVIDFSASKREELKALAKKNLAS